jgi:2-polyprenyl-3-methyl-5-hydroxy-6-metoxy-1,4-benzoquinol methylase
MPRTPSPAEAFAQLQTTLDPYLQSAATILEAGGGSASHINLPADAEITVIDISPEQLANHQTARHKILGDLHTVDFGVAHFDAAIIWNVIEHLENPTLVLDKLRAAIRPGGILIIAAPHPASLQSKIAKWTPHSFHVFVLKHVFKSKTAGLPGFPPFPTVHHADIDPHHLQAWANQHNLETLLYLEYESTRRAVLHQRSPAIAHLWNLAIKLGNIVSRSPLEASDYFFVVKAR